MSSKRILAALESIKRTHAQVVSEVALKERALREEIAKAKAEISEIEAEIGSPRL